METLESIILKKKRCEELSLDDFTVVANALIDDYNDEKLSGFLLSLNDDNFSLQESYNFSVALANSGKVIDASKKIGPCVSKISAGYVSDGTSLIVMSVLASLGVKVVKLSSSKLGSYGNTISKLNMFDGFSAGVSETKFLKIADSVGCSILENKGNIAPADANLIKLMKSLNCTSINLLACSLVAKKIALGVNLVVYDVKCGEGGLIKNKSDAYKLAKILVKISKMAGMSAACVVTTMHQPVSASVGALTELKEVVRSLSSGNSYMNSDLMTVAKEIVQISLILAGKVSGRTQASEMFDTAVSSGQALSKFKEIVLAFGGDLETLSLDSSILSNVATSYVVADEDGYLADIDSTALYSAFESMQNISGKKVDKNAGIVFLEREGTKLKAGDKIARITYSFDNKNFAKAYKNICDAVVVHSQKPKREKLLVKVFV